MSDERVRLRSLFQQRHAGRSVKLDSKLQQKIQCVMRLAIEDAKRYGLNVEETMQLIADRLINDPDPDVVAFQEPHNRHIRRDLN
jgi:hypothetical protein